ncbi:unnamed protein product [Effrenium voratum]|uniref:Ion transport domain-containing protein n=1 Tax=Effrenium voratum TaxID=2562239 RepID=A0AA36IDH2_9DINO|nr:unnamed protein product [Effrenium voratum]|mmetsp:Transcript_77263/g.185045  ORF Transcript_77263/g.185045 Transcript_77263/m.185045 type:complete len:712 (+) Transcript_77263:40-2175(+)
MADDKYQELLGEQLQALQETLLQEHRKSSHRLHQENRRLTREVTTLNQKLAHIEKDAGICFVVPPGDEQQDSESATTSLEQCQLPEERLGRWALICAKLLDHSLLEDLGELTGASPVHDARTEQLDLTMRPEWHMSLMSFRPLVQKSKIMDASIAGSGKINDAVTDDNSCLQRFVFGPQSQQQLVWSIIACILIIWDLITIPLEFFDVSDFVWALDSMHWFSLFFWMLDMPSHLIFGLQRGGTLELRPRMLGMIYLRSWFCVDVLVVLIDATLVTLESVGADLGNALRSARFLRTLRLLRLVRLVRIAKLQRELSLLATRFLSLYAFMVMKIVSALLMMLAINHLIACCWYGIASRIPSENNWLVSMGMDQAPFLDSYAASLHWSLTQFTPATNNIAPDNALERLFAIFVILLAMGVFSSIIGSISSAVNSLRAVRGEKVKRQANLLQFFVERDLSLDLYAKVQEVLRSERMVDVRLQESEVALVQLLPERYKMQLHEEIYLSPILALGFWPEWNYMEDAFFYRQLCHHAVVEHVAKRGQDAFMPATPCNEVYVIQSGQMSYTAAAANQPPDSVSSGDILCLPCFWAEWQHVGRLTAMHAGGTCYYFGINANDFCNLAMRSGKPLYRYLQVFGILLVGAYETIEGGEVLTDLCLPPEQLKELAGRAARFETILSSKSGPYGQFDQQNHMAAAQFMRIISQATESQTSHQWL